MNQSTQSTSGRSTIENHQELLETLAQHENNLQFTVFTNETALELGLRLVAAAKRDGKAVMVDICRNGQQLFHYAMPGMTTHNADAIRRKNNVVRRFGHSSWYVGTSYLARNTSFEERTKFDPREFAVDGGGFPLIIKNVGVVGTISISGLPQAEDHALIVNELMSFLRQVRDEAGATASKPVNF